MSVIPAKIHRPTRLKKAVISALAALATVPAHTAPATTNFFTGATSTEVPLDANWSGNALDNADPAATPPTTSGPNVINLSTATWTPTPTYADPDGDPSTPDEYVAPDPFNFPETLSVGSGSGTTGVLTIRPAPDTTSFEWDTKLYPSGSIPAVFTVGQAGGNGTFLLDLTPHPSTDPGGNMRSTSGKMGMSVGMGAGSKGAATVLGTGKTPEEMSPQSFNSALMNSPYQASTVGGGSGGQGNLTINGAGLTLLTGDPNDFMVGDGPGSVGAVDILKSGKLGAGAPVNSLSYGKDSQSIIGNNKGVGTVTVHDDATSAFPNQANFISGVTVGNKGGNGTLDVLSGGKAYAGSNFDMPGYGTCSKPDPALQISSDSLSKGVVRVAGASSQLLVAGKMGITSLNYSTTPPTLVNPPLGESNIGSIDISTGGALVTTDSGLVKVGVANISPVIIPSTDPTAPPKGYYSDQFTGGFGPININNDGQVAYGSEVVSTPKAPGSIEASAINLLGTNATTRFNHTGSINVSVPIVGIGQVVQNAGNTTLIGSTTAPALPADWQMGTTCIVDTSTYPTDQSGFTGTLNVLGGKLTLPTPLVVPNVSATRISNGTLFMGNTSQNLGAVTMSGGVLDLSGGQNSDVVNATSWNGTGGIVKLDTILGATGNTSDVIHITGPITGTTTRLHINVIGGQGALTTGNGIPVVLADTDPSSVATHFQLESIVSDNGYNYSLQLVNGNWYLQSAAAPTPPPTPTAPTAPTAVPTMSTFGLMGLSTLLAALSGSVLRRRKSKPGTASS